MKIRDIRSLVEMKLDLDLSDKSRKRELVYARAIYFKLCRVLTKETLYRIGKSLNQNHATVLNGISIYDNVISEGYEPYYNKIYHSLRRRLQGEISMENLALNATIADLRKALVDIETKLVELEEQYLQ